MQESIYLKRESYSRIRDIVKDAIGDKLLAIIVFGSIMYMGKGNDVDLVIVVDKDLELREKLELEYMLARKLTSAFSNKLVFDIHVFSLKDFIDNLKPGSFLSGLALGYKIIYDKYNIEKHIIEFLKELTRTRYVLHNRYGSWDLSFYAKLLLKRKGHYDT